MKCCIHVYTLTIPGVGFFQQGLSSHVLAALVGCNWVALHARKTAAPISSNCLQSPELFFQTRSFLIFQMLQSVTTKLQRSFTCKLSKKTFDPINQLVSLSDEARTKLLPDRLGHFTVHSGRKGVMLI
ncbi:unnamed protein product [Cuscuta epithymum]|uniref:Uncharacterized protein n=1 Tax=Cuscuta epithymum TaxID=186058 RepID=A0AAV0EXI2_9ASTE|nr:unnamed protein product [Cuscuta epithymum]